MGGYQNSGWGKALVVSKKERRCSNPRPKGVVICFMLGCQAAVDAVFLLDDFFSAQVYMEPQDSSSVWG